VRLVAIQDNGPGHSPGYRVIGGSSLRKAAGCLAVHAQFPRDRAQAHTAGAQGLHSGVLVPHARCQPGLRYGNRSGGRMRLRLGFWRSGGRGDLLEAGLVPRDCLHSMPGEAAANASVQRPKALRGRSREPPVLAACVAQRGAGGCGHAVRLQLGLAASGLLIALYSTHRGVAAQVTRLARPSYDAEYQLAARVNTIARCAAYGVRQIRQDLATGGRDVARIVHGYLGSAATSWPVTPCQVGGRDRAASIGGITLSHGGGHGERSPSRLWAGQGGEFSAVPAAPNG